MLKRVSKALHPPPLLHHQLCHVLIEKQLLDRNLIEEHHDGLI